MRRNPEVGDDCAGCGEMLTEWPTVDDAGELPLQPMLLCTCRAARWWADLKREGWVREDSLDTEAAMATMGTGLSVYVVPGGTTDGDEVRIMREWPALVVSLWATGGRRDSAMRRDGTVYPSLVALWRGPAQDAEWEQAVRALHNIDPLGAASYVWREAWAAYGRTGAQPRVHGRADRTRKHPDRHGPRRMR